MIPGIYESTLLHPHPAYGGTMNNKVVYNLHYAFYNLGFTVLRFNFRGVGRSQGEYDMGIGELSDAAAALDQPARCGGSKQAGCANGIRRAFDQGVRRAGRRR